MEKTFYVYILASRRNGTLYVGITSDLVRRVWEHKKKIFKGFTSKYHVDKLVYFEVHEEVFHAIHREKRIKEWSRKLKLNLIEQFNPSWNDLYNFIAI